MSERIHATTVAIRGRGVALLGASGSGKSDLALRLIDRGAVLVSDDYTEIEAIDGVVMAKAPRTIAGLIEVRGVGIVTVPHLDNVEIALAVQLGQAAVRMPDAAHEMIAGIAVPKLLLDAREPSVPIKVEIALARLIEGHP